MVPNIAELAAHPENLGKDTLYALREVVARYPYYQAARILFLKNLFILHDTSFGEELRKAAIYIPDRRVLFQMVEGTNYELRAEQASDAEAEPTENMSASERTNTLIDRFLNTLEPEEDTPSQPLRRQPTAIDATTDYAAYLMQMDDAVATVPTTAAKSKRQKRSSELIEGFIGHSTSRIVLQDTPTADTDLPPESTQEGNEEDYFTETLAKIYVKQGRYEKAMEIISKLNLNYPKKNRYFADQMRFLHKLAINQKHNK